MSKTIFVGDIHTKHGIIERIENLINIDKEIEKVVFVGDYVDDWSTDAEYNEIMLEIMFNLKKKYSDKVVLLLGNHELSYMGYPCSGHKKPDEKTSKLLFDNIDLIDVIYKTEDFICSHAGLTELWLNDLKDKYNISCIEGLDKMVDRINQMFHNKDGSIMRSLSCASYSSGGYSYIASCLWSRPDDHRFSPINLGVDQIVGHTPTSVELKYRAKNVIVEGKEIDDKIIYIDTFSTYPVTEEPVGKQEILIFDHDTKSYYSRSLVTDKIEFIFQRSPYEKL